MGPPEFGLEGPLPSCFAMRKPWSRKPWNPESVGIQKALESRMARTIWVAVFCLATLGAGAAIRIAAPSASSVEPGSHPRKIDPIDLVLAPNESAKSDRLPLPDIRAEPETIPGRHWQDANAKASPGEVDIGSREEGASVKEEQPPIRADRHGSGSRIAPSERSHRHTMTREPKVSESTKSPKPRAEVWHCRQDAMGSILRSLDLSPRCNM
jgi:hypothetical protein